MGFWETVDELVGRLDSISYFELLGVATDAQPMVIQDAYYAALRRFHPDGHLAGDRVADRQRQLSLICARVGEAYRTLSNPETRATYLATGAARTTTVPRKRSPTDSRDPRTDKGRSMLASARELLERGNRSGARAKLELALQFEPESKVLREELDNLAPRKAPPAETP